MRTDLYLFTTNFPTGLSGELWLQNEILITHKNYERIFIFPDHDGYDPVLLPINCYPQQNVLTISQKETLSIVDLFRISSIILSDLIVLSRRKAFFSNLRYNISLIKKLYKKAKFISRQIEKPEKSVLYSYWADNAATLACMVKVFKPTVKAISRAHGYEIYEDLKKDKIIPFRNYQNKIIDHIYSVSKKGAEHLKRKHPSFANKYSFSYLGTNDHGLAIFDPNEVFSIATCCNLNSIKRIELVSEILQNVNHKMRWHLIGDGPEMSKIKKANSILPANIEVIYHGSMNQDRLFEFYRKTYLNALLSVSYSEGLPVTMMEAISFGIPLISTNVGGCNEICNENTGVLFDRDFKGKDVAQLILEFRTSKMNTTEFREKCRTFWLENFSAENNYNNFSRAICIDIRP